MSKTCMNCRHEPVWAFREFPNAAYNCVSGKCRFPVGHKQLRIRKLPSGCVVSPPWVEKDKPKKNCGAWEPEEASK